MSQPILENELEYEHVSQLCTLGSLFCMSELCGKCCQQLRMLGQGEFFLLVSLGISCSSYHTVYDFDR